MIFTLWRSDWEGLAIFGDSSILKCAIAKMESLRWMESVVWCRKPPIANQVLRVEMSRPAGGEWEGAKRL